MVQKIPSLKFTTDAQNPTDPGGFVKYFQRIIHSMPNNVYWLNSECITMGCNKNTLDLLGLDSVDQFIGMTYEEMGELAGWTDNQADSFKKDDMEVISSGKPKINIEEPPLYDDNGDPVYYMSTRVPIFDDNDNVMGVVGISVDITDRKKMEERLKRKQVNEVKSEFIANMSHDLRTPMTGVMGMLDEIDLLAKDATDILLNLDQHVSSRLKNIVDSIKQYAGIAQNSNKELLSIFNDILELIKLDSGKVEYKEESFSLRSLIQKQEALMAPVAKDKHLKLFIDIDPRVPEFVSGFWDPLSRSIINLLTNACKFTDNGSVTIGVTPLFDGGCKVGDSIPIKIWVKDTGVGIPKDKFDEIFGHFYKLESSYKNSSYQGSGLGLHSVKKYVDYMGGSIDLDSKVGEGACFSINVAMVVSDRSDRDDDMPELIPYVHKANENTISSDEEIDYGVGRVMVVEDNPTAAQSVMNALKRLGYTSDWASNGEEAVDMASNNDYSIIFMDIGLPEMNGLEATEKIRSISNEKRSQVPIVALTGHEDRVKECTDAGMQGLMQKPAQSNKIKEMLAKQGVGSDELLSLPIIDWDECVSMCFGEEEAREITSMCAQGIRDGKKTIEKYYNDKDISMLRAELHKARGGVCYLKLPELEYCLRDFHVAIKENHDPDELENKYKALVEAEDRFLAMCSDRGLL